MKKLLTLFAILIHFLIDAQNEPELFPINDRSVGYLGYYLKDGKTNVVEPQFCSASYITDGYYLVSKAKHEIDDNGYRKENHLPNTEKFAILNSKGEIIIDFENNYDYIGVSEGVIFVIKNNLSGVVNDKNEILIPLIYNELDIKSKNWISVKKDNKKSGILNHLGETVIPFQYDFFGEPVFDDKKISVIVQLGNQSGVIDQNNQFVVPLVNMDLRYLTKASIIAKRNNKFGLVDYKLKTILPFEFETLDIYEDKIVGNKKGEYFYYTIAGKFLDKKRNSL